MRPVELRGLDQQAKVNDCTFTLCPRCGERMSRGHLDATCKGKSINICPSAKCSHWYYVIDEIEPIDINDLPFDTIDELKRCANISNVIEVRTIHRMKIRGEWILDVIDGREQAIELVKEHLSPVEAAKVAACILTALEESGVIDGELISDELIKELSTVTEMDLESFTVKEPTPEEGGLPW